MAKRKAKTKPKKWQKVVLDVESQTIIVQCNDDIIGNFNKHPHPTYTSSESPSESSQDDEAWPATSQNGGRRKRERSWDDATLLSPLRKSAKSATISSRCWADIAATGAGVDRFARRVNTDQALERTTGDWLALAWVEPRFDPQAGGFVV